MPVEVGSQALVKVEGASYSTPSRWARLQATAYIGVDQIRLVCLNESVTHPRVRPGGRQVFYRDYLPELARKPKAVRQVAEAFQGYLKATQALRDAIEAQGYHCRAERLS